MQNNKPETINRLPFEERIKYISDERLQNLYASSLKRLQQEITQGTVSTNQKVRSEIERRQQMMNGQNESQAVVQQIAEANRDAQRANALRARRQIYGAMQIEPINPQNPNDLPDQEQNFGGSDLKYYKPKPYKGNSQSLFIEGIDDNPTIIPPQYAQRSVENASVYWARGDEVPENANDEQIQTYFDKKVPKDALTNNFKKILANVFPMIQFGNGFAVEVNSVNPEIQKFAREGFKQYIRQIQGKDAVKTVITVRPTVKYMAKPSATASAYERVVLGQTKRIIKRLIQAVAASKMSIKTLNKAYELDKADYNKYKYMLPGPRINKVKQWARKYGTLDADLVQIQQKANNKEYIDGMTRALNERQDKFAEVNRPYFTPFNQERINVLFGRIPSIRKRPVVVPTLSARSAARINAYQLQQQAQQAQQAPPNA